MRKLKKIISVLLIYLVCLLFLSALSFIDGHSLYQVLQGFVPGNDLSRAGIRVNLLTASRWLFVVLPPLWCCGYIVDIHRNRIMLEAPRCGGYLSWWRFILSQMLAVLALYVLCLCFAMSLEGGSFTVVWGIIVLAFMHLCLAGSVMLLLVLLLHQTIMAVLLVLVAETGILMFADKVGWSGNFIPVFWAMYQRSSWAYTGGFVSGAVIFAEIVICIIITCVVLRFGRCEHSL